MSRYLRPDICTPLLVKYLSKKVENFQIASVRCTNVGRQCRCMIIERKCRGAKTGCASVVAHICGRKSPPPLGDQGNFVDFLIKSWHLRKKCYELKMFLL